MIEMHCIVLCFLIVITFFILLIILKPYLFFNINKRYLCTPTTAKIKYTFDKMKMLEFMRNYPKHEIHFRNFKSKQEYYETLKEYIIEQDKENAKLFYRDILLDEILQKSNIPKLPKLCVLYEKRKLVKDFKKTSLQTSLHKTMSLDIFKMTAEETAKSKAEKKLILKTLAKQLKVKVTKEDKDKFSTYSYFEILEHNVKSELCRKYLEIY